MGQTIADDKKEGITSAIISYIENGADIVVCIGGMSVDPDDCTPGAISRIQEQKLSHTVRLFFREQCF